MSCNKVIAEYAGKDRMFQSLSGFLMSCNMMAQITIERIETMFQSLSGFLMSCNEFWRFVANPQWFVSIPIGFSNEL